MVSESVDIEVSFSEGDFLHAGREPELAKELAQILAELLGIDGFLLLAESPLAGQRQAYMFILQSGGVAG